MHPDCSPGSPQCDQGHEFSTALLVAKTPRDVIAALAATLPVGIACAFSSPRWPEAIASEPAADDAQLARAVREVAACRAGGGADPRSLLLCDEPGGAVALVRLESPLPAGARARRDCELAGRRLAELLALQRLRADVSHLEKAEQLQRALYAIADMAGSELDMPDMLRGLHSIISGLMYAENFYIALYDEATDSLRFAYFADTMDQDGPPAGEVVPMSRIQHGLTWYLVKDARPMMGSTEELRAQMSGPLSLHGADSTDWLGVPMLRDGRVLGALVVQSYLEGTRYTSADMTLLSFVAEHILTALERKGAQEQLEQRVEERTRQLAQANRDLSREVAERQRGERLQAALYRLAALATSEDSSDAFYRSVHQIVGGLIDARNFYIALLSDDGREVSFPYAVDACETDWSPRSSGRGLTEYVLRTGQPQVVGGARMLELIRAGEVDPRYVDSASTSWLGAPLLGVDGPIGTVAVQSYSQARGYDARDAELLAFAAHQIANSLRRRRAAEALREANAQLEARVEKRTRELREQVAQREEAEARLRHQVMHDPLTGLPNRVYLLDRVDRAIAQLRRDPSRPFALLYIDVDRFKQINDNLGHLAGDDVLCEVATRLKDIVREPDVVARLSGDEFAVLLERLEASSDASHVAERIIAALARPVAVGERQLHTSASIGVAVSGDARRATDEVLLDADIALYRAKERGRNQHVLFEESMRRPGTDPLA
ncbi:MAG: diguanylate cyclase [Lysobacteraceae bacterium]|nr:MAG: diguanylate cyclase [Xanthomonadaceae bacterium]